MLKRTSAPSVLAWIYLMRIYAAVTRGAERELEAEGLSMPRFDVLAQLAALEKPCTQEYLGRRLMVTKGNISNLIRRMEEDGLLTRRSDPANRRANRVELTEAGRRLARRVIPGHEQWISNVFKGLKRGELQVLRDQLRTVLRGVKEKGGSHD